MCGFISRFSVLFHCSMGMLSCQYPTVLTSIASEYSVKSGLPSNSGGKESVCNVGDLGLIPGSGRSPQEGNGNPLQCSCLENSMDRGVWWTIVLGVTKSQTRLSNTHSVKSEGVTCSSFSRFLWLPGVFCDSTQIWGLFVLFL